MSEDYLGEKVVEDLNNTPFVGYTAKDWALEYISRYGGIDGAHHKQWVLDQVVRILLGTPVIVKQATWGTADKIRESEWRIDTADEPTGAYRAWVTGRNATSKSGSVAPNASPTEFALAIIFANAQPDVDVEAAMTRGEIRDMNLMLHDLDMHCAWVLDQVARILHDTPVISTSPIKTGEPSDAYNEWFDELLGDEDEEGEREHDRECGEPLPESARRLGDYYEGIAP